GPPKIITNTRIEKISWPTTSSKAPGQGHSNAARTMRTKITTSQTSRNNDSSVMNCDGCSLAWTCVATEFSMGTSSGANTVLTPNVAVMVCGYRSRFFARYNATWYQTSIDVVPMISSTGQFRSCVDTDAITIAEMTT